MERSSIVLVIMINSIAMFGWFKSDPVKKLEIKKNELLSKAYELSKSNRKAADDLMAKAAEIDEEINTILNERSKEKK
jgi:hypothetical protein